jgi:glycosyltransferase involved in cell wall biosynthesis
VKIVSISSVFPNPNEPGLGLFVRSRLLHMARSADVVVVAPVPAVDYSNPQRRWLHGLRVPPRREDAGIQILHPRWLFPPGGTPVNVFCLFFRLLWTLVRVRRRFRFDIIDAHFGYPEGVAAMLLARVFGCPAAITLRGSEPVFGAYRFRGRCLRWALRRADGIFAVSEQLRRFAIDAGAKPERVRTIPNGIDRHVFYPRDSARCRVKWGMREERRTVVCAGELIEAKGHHMVIGAVRNLIAEGHAVDLYIAGGLARGGAPFDQRLARSIEEWNLGANVRLVGWINREALAELMSAADVFCLASFTEGWPNVVAEALACGTPVVATEVGAVPDMLPDERYGIIVPPREQDLLTGALRRAITVRWDREAIAAWGRSRSWEDVGREVIESMECMVHAADFDYRERDLIQNVRN